MGIRRAFTFTKEQDVTLSAFAAAEGRSINAAMAAPAAANGNDRIALSGGISQRAATCIVDFYHAREHLTSLAKSLEFMLLDHYGEWLAVRMAGPAACSLAPVPSSPGARRSWP